MNQSQIRTDTIHIMGEASYIQSFTSGDKGMRRRRKNIQRMIARRLANKPCSPRSADTIA